MSLPLTSRKLDLVYFIYFIQHAIVTVLIDSTVVIPREYQLPIQQFLSDFHIESNKDILLLQKPIWLQSYIWLELLFQLPLFIIGPYYLLKGIKIKTSNNPFISILTFHFFFFLLLIDNKNIYIPMLIYAVEASTTTFACLIEVLFLNQLTLSEKSNLAALYAPILAVGLLMLVDMAVRIGSWIPKPISKESVKNKKEK